MAERAAELMRRITLGDAGALGELIVTFEGVLRRHLERYVPAADAEDLLQEVWLRVWQRGPQWDGRGRPLAWLLAIATNLALNHLRGRRDLVSLGALSCEDASEAQAERAESKPWPEGAGLLRRAMSAENPGEVFAQAADKGEADPLTDPDVRLWMGLLPLSDAV